MTKEATQKRIFQTVANLRSLPHVSVTQVDGLNVFTIEHTWVFVPDFRFEWDIAKEQYRVYIYVAGSSHDKRCAGYVICTIGSGLTASGFNMLYSFLHKNRANNKTGQ